MTQKAAITVLRPREEVERLWRAADHRSEYLDGADATVTFREAPGDRGTEIHVALGGSNGVREIFQQVTGAAPLAKAKDELRRFKQRVETGEVARSDAAPQGELVEQKFKQRPAQPLTESEREKVQA
jgi:uncharacterized membrane protein